MSTADTEHGFLALEAASGSMRGTSVLCERLMAMKDVFYGGAATALVCSMMEHASQRPAVWCSVQMVSTAAVGDRLEVEVEEIRAGRRVAHLRVGGRVGDREVFFGIGSVGHGEAGVDATFATMPTVGAPGDCPPVVWSFATHPEHTYFGIVDMREALTDMATGESSPTVARWARIPTLPVWTRAKLAFIADTASTGIAQAVRRASGTSRPGSSLDNSLRFGAPCADEWVLVVTHADVVHNGFGHGTVHIWAEDGTLLALGSQTFAFRSQHP